MSRIIIILFIISATISQSCKKNHCWECECLTTVNGVKPPDQIICQDNKPNIDHPDSNGVQIQYDCKK